MSSELFQLWEYLAPAHQEIFGVLGAAILYGIGWFLRPSVKLVFGRANNSLNVISLPNPEDETAPNSLEVFVEKFFLQNTGTKTATDVEFVLSSFPTDIRVWQPRDVKYLTVEKNNCLVAIPRIAPGELVIIDCAYLNVRAAFVSSVKCAEALGKEVPFQTIRKFPRWFEACVLGLIFFGLAFLIQLIIGTLSEVDNEIRPLPAQRTPQHRHHSR